MSDDRRLSNNGLLSTTDMMQWAEEFCRIFRGKVVGEDDVDEGLMVGWFANAFELGRGIGRKELCPHNWNQLDPDLWVCRDCGTAVEEDPTGTRTLEEHFVEGFQEGRQE
jgi:hypothetical protein